MMLTFGTGISPDDRRNNNQLAGLNKIRSKRAEMIFKIFLKKYNVISLGAGYLRQQSEEKVRSYQINTTLGYHKIF